MRQVKIGEENMETLDGGTIWCPMSGGESFLGCFQTCAWFRIETEYPSTARDGDPKERYAYCGDKLIGEVVG